VTIEKHVHSLYRTDEGVKNNKKKNKRKIDTIEVFYRIKNETDAFHSQMYEK
jgi:hypothetical protein